MKWLMINAFTTHSNIWPRFSSQCVYEQYSKAPSSVLRFVKIWFSCACSLTFSRPKLVSYNLWSFNLNVFSLFASFSSQEDMKWPTNDPNRIPFWCPCVYLSSQFCTPYCARGFNVQYSILSVAIVSALPLFWREWIITTVNKHSIVSLQYPAIVHNDQEVEICYSLLQNHIQKNSFGI